MRPVQSITMTNPASATVTTSQFASSMSSRPAPKDTKQAAAQFEAIILRQLLEPVIQPAMSGLGGAAGSGGSIYGYMLTDAMANQLSQGGGLGLSKMLEKEFTPQGASPTPEVTSSAALKLHPSTVLPRE